MAKKWLMTAVVFGLVVMIGGCGGKYSDVIELNKRFVKLMNDFSDEVIEVNSADGAASALNGLADEMEKLAPEMREMSEKYPELNDPDNLPEPLQKSREESQAAGQRYAQSFMKLMPYMSGSGVQAAHARLARVMSDMGPAQK
ncbi:MAG: hypothetical protein SWH68_08955 [Thermodesulfobacteriota bacterium]|nr:hypothetical protein [Thermodesulfobacteriota bacterium]